jgi:hypothetical protein
MHRGVDAREQAREQREQARARRRGRPDATLLASRWGRALLAAVGLLAVLTVAGLMVLWPHGGGHRAASQAMGGATQGALVTRAFATRCRGPVEQRCLAIDVRLTSGAGKARWLGSRSDRSGRWRRSSPAPRSAYRRPAAPTPTPALTVACRCSGWPSRSSPSSR